MGTPRRRFDFNAFDKQIGTVLESVPTTRENADHLMAIESDAIDELAAEVAVGWITSDYADDRLRELRALTHPEPELTVINLTVSS